MYEKLRKRYDDMFRKKWPPLKYLSEHIDYSERLVTVVGTRI